MGKVKEFWTENKELIIGTTCVVVGAGCVAIGVSGAKHLFKKDVVSKVDKFLKSPESGILGECCQVEAVSKRYSWWRRDMSDVKYTIADLGKAGEDLVNLAEGRVTPDTDVTGILLYHM